MLAALDDLTAAADRVRTWVTAKHHAAIALRGNAAVTELTVTAAPSVAGAGS